MSPNGSVDVLISAAWRAEYDAARAVVGEARWREQDSGGSAPYLTTVHRGLSVALARPVRMGGRGTAPIVTTLTDLLRPRCLAMCGVCAGHPYETALGDVVVASQAYEWDEGKYTGSDFRPDPQQFPLDARWVRAAQEFDRTILPSYGAATRDEADVWYLERLLRKVNPRKHTARDRYFPRGTWAAGLGRLHSQGLITEQGGAWALTGAGREHIKRILYLEPDGPDHLPFAVHVGPMASGSAVMAGRDTWERLTTAHRSVLAVEMEAATVATVAYERQVPHWLVAKGVMDHADVHKDDRFKRFAARTSAEVLFALLGKLMAPAGRPAAATSPVPLPVKREILRRMTYDWQDVAEFVGVAPYETHRFRAGDEPSDLWDWLSARGRLGDLPGALHEVGRADLAELLRPYV